MLPRTSLIWRRDSHPTASDKPGVVQTDTVEALVGNLIGLS